MPRTYRHQAGILFSLLEVVFSLTVNTFEKLLVILKIE